MPVVELMRRTVSHPFRADGRLVFERPVERRVDGGQVEAAHGRAGYAVTAAATMEKRKNRTNLTTPLASVGRRSVTWA